MPKIIGRYQQGGMSAQPNYGPAEAGVPNRAAPAGAVPRGEQHQREGISTSTANEKRPR